MGRPEAGGQFWIDTQLRGEGDTTRDFVATYVFDDDGILIWNEIIDIGLRSDPDQRRSSSVIKEQLNKLGPHQITDINVFPFSVEAFGSTFGLVVRKPDPECDEDPEDVLVDGEPVLDALPGMTLMFYPPWDGCCYDT